MLPRPGQAGTQHLDAPPTSLMSWQSPHAASLLLLPQALEQPDQAACKSGPPPSPGRAELDLTTSRLRLAGTSKTYPPPGPILAPPSGSNYSQAPPPPPGNQGQGNGSVAIPAPIVDPIQNTPITALLDGAATTGALSCLVSACACCSLRAGPGQQAWGQ